MKTICLFKASSDAKGRLDVHDDVNKCMKYVSLEGFYRVTSGHWNHPPLDVVTLLNKTKIR